MKKTLLITFFLGFIQINYAQKTTRKHIVEIKKMKFNPTVIHVKKGDTIVWINKDFFPHDVAKFDDKSWSSPPIEKGESWSKIITKNEDYYCTLHIVMKGKIIIKD